MVYVPKIVTTLGVLAIAVDIGITAVSGNDANFLFTANRLPAKGVTPTLANGNIGFVVYGDTVHMNGVYNGYGGESHRARIPNYANIQITNCAATVVEPTGCFYQLDMQNNMFRTVYDDPEQNFRIVHDVYPNRYFDMAIVNKIRIQRLNSQSVITINIERFIDSRSVDFKFSQPQLVDIDGESFNRLCGRTVVIEDVRYQHYDGHEVCIHYPQLPILLTLDVDKTAEEYTFYTVFSHSTIEGENELRAMKRSNVESFHKREQQRVWERYGITVDGNDNLDRVLKASSFYLSSSLPSTYTNQISSYPFYGLSPSGLGRGGEELKEYQGHSFWDTEMWMFPPILLMDPHNARKLLHYRTVVYKPAEDRGPYHYSDGWMFPLESAFTGTETTPKLRPSLTEMQQHITADIAFAARMYFYATEDLDWMYTDGCRLAYETSKFWKNRVRYNKETDLFELHRIMGPDEHHYNVSNNAFTNVVVAHNLMFGYFAGCLCPASIFGITEEQKESAQFIEVAKGMTLLYDEEIDFHPQFEGYQLGTPIQQADVVLLGYPLQFPMNSSTKANNLEIYSNVTRSDAPPMTWAMYSISHLELGQMAEAEKMFTKSYQSYMRAPYNIWSENANGTDGSGNFISGAGGFLQSVINGYAGVRLRNGELVITKPSLLPGTTRLYIPEINYMNVKLSLEVTNNNTTLGVKDGSLTSTVQFIVDEQARKICNSCFVSFNNRLVIRPVRQSFNEFNGCKLPETKVGIKWADQDNSANAVHLTRVLIGALFVVFILQKLL